ncbi:MAG: NAD+ synthase [Patescibacteria group bacterium]|jgi:NAD+ synthase (glutamine-hydrolysing)
MKIAIAQINTTVGDLVGNTNKVVDCIKKAKKKKVDLVVFPELTITGYPPKDLLLKAKFINDNKKKLAKIIEETKNIAVVVGFVDKEKNKLYNAATFIKNKKLVGIQHKTHLPNYDVFDERRYFTSAKECKIFELGGHKIGISICEDIWVDNGPVDSQAADGANIIINVSASPFYINKTRIRRELISRRAKSNKVTIIYNNLVGGQDDLVFDGRSYVFNNKGKLIIEGKHFEEDFLIFDSERRYDRVKVNDDCLKEIFLALVLGIKDYVKKNKFKQVVVGLSGGIDSALVTVLAVHALGKDNVFGVSMPSIISSKGSLDDSKRLAQNLGINYKVIPIIGIINSYSETLLDEFKNTQPNIAEENIQARVRGNILMALSNKFNYLVLTTGNKSEFAVGYCTLYGDMVGGFAPISDVLKTLIYKLADYINNNYPNTIIPKSIILKEPSAELRVGQKDSDSLPRYEILDQVLKKYIEEGKNKKEIAHLGIDGSIIEEIVYKVDHNEFKRQQAALGIKITQKAFGSGRRMPITNLYRD